MRGHRDVLMLASCEGEWDGSQGMGRGHRIWGGVTGMC